MKIDERVYYYNNNKMNLLSSYTSIHNIDDVEKVIKKWYRIHPYAKMLNDTWICGDYRIDQQRPQRKVYSEAYLKIVEITEMEKGRFKELIDNIESNIKYPCVWDDGKNKYYEDVIHCPKCGVMRTSLSSKTHCENCGFEFKKVRKCLKCKDLSLKGSKKCNHCGFEFDKNSVFGVPKKSNIEVPRCPKCGSVKSKYNHKCRHCNFDFTGKKQCPKCNSWIDDDSNFCTECGQKLLKLRVCDLCNAKNNMEDKFCRQCGHRLRW